MTKEVSGKNETRVFVEKGDFISIDNKKENMESENGLRFVEQQENNQKIKKAMAEELRKMELPDHMVNEILNLEDEEVPF